MIIWRLLINLQDPNKTSPHYPSLMVPSGNQNKKTCKSGKNFITV